MSQLGCLVCGPRRREISDLIHARVGMTTDINNRECKGCRISPPRPTAGLLCFVCLLSTPLMTTQQVSLEKCTIGILGVFFSVAILNLSLRALHIFVTVLVMASSTAITDDSCIMHIMLNDLPRHAYPASATCQVPTKGWCGSLGNGPVARDRPCSGDAGLDACTGPCMYATRAGGRVTDAFSTAKGDIPRLLQAAVENYNRA